MRCYVAIAGHDRRHRGCVHLRHHDRVYRTGRGHG